MRWWRRVGLPGTVRAGLTLDPGERVLSAASMDGSAFAVATDRALYLPIDNGSRRLPYEQIIKVLWDDETATLTVLVPDAEGGRLEVALVEPGFLPETVRERVQSTIVYSRQVPLQGSMGVLIAARRTPGATEPRWTMVFDAGIDGRDPAIRERATRALSELRAQTGI